MTSSWFFLSTLNYDARSTIRQTCIKCLPIITVMSPTRNFAVDSCERLMTCVTHTHTHTHSIHCSEWSRAFRVALPSAFWGSRFRKLKQTLTVGRLTFYTVFLSRAKKNSRLYFNFFKLSGSFIWHQAQHSIILPSGPTGLIWVCMDLRTNFSYFLVQH